MSVATQDPQQFVIILLVVIVCIQVIAEVLLFLFFAFQLKNAYMSITGINPSHEPRRRPVDDLLNT